jgi:hypothetical protein
MAWATGKRISMKLLFAPAFLFFTMAVSVYHHEDKNKEATCEQHNENRPVLPKLRNQVAKVGSDSSNHPLAIYIHAG